MSQYCDQWQLNFSQLYLSNMIMVLPCFFLGCSCVYVHCVCVCAIVLYVYLSVCMCLCLFSNVCVFVYLLCVPCFYLLIFIINSLLCMILLFFSATVFRLFWFNISFTLSLPSIFSNMSLYATQSQLNMCIWLSFSA